MFIHIILLYVVLLPVDCQQKLFRVCMFEQTEQLWTMIPVMFMEPDAFIKRAISGLQDISSPSLVYSKLDERQEMVFYQNLKFANQMNSKTSFFLAETGRVAMIFTILSLATSSWWILPSIGGIFSIWREVPGREYVPSTKLEVVRAFLLLGLFAQIGALFILNLMTFGKITKPSYASIAFVLAGIFLCVAMSVFTSLSNQFADLPLSEEPRYGYSFYLGWISMAISFILSVAVQLTRFLKYETI